MFPIITFKQHKFSQSDPVLILPKLAPVLIRVHLWPESLFQTPTPLLFQNFWIRVRLFFKYENPTPVQTPATIIDPTVICPCFYLGNNRTSSRYCRNWKVTPDPGLREKCRILPESTPVIRIRSNLWREHSQSQLKFSPVLKHTSLKQKSSFLLCKPVCRSNVSSFSKNHSDSSLESSILTRVESFSKKCESCQSHHRSLLDSSRVRVTKSRLIYSSHAITAPW